MLLYIVKKQLFQTIGELRTLHFCCFSWNFGVTQAVVTEMETSSNEKYPSEQMFFHNNYYSKKYQ